MSSIQEELGMILAKAKPMELGALAAILKADSPRSDHIVTAFRLNYRSVFGHPVGKDPSYSQIVCQVADKLDIAHFGVIVEALEVEIARKVLQTVWKKMTPEQKMAMEAELRRVAQEFDKGGALAESTSIFTALTAPQLSGFGVYLLASTALGVLTSGTGVTLPFVIYDTMSTAIAVSTGPVGWLFAIWKLTGANYKRLIPAILYVSALRAKQQGNFS